MFIIWAMLIMGIPLMGIILWSWWHNRQVDKYNEWLKEQGNEQESVTPVSGH